MSKFETFGQEIRVACEGLSDKAIAARLAKYARAELQRRIASGEASSSYRRFVNGQEGVAEESVVAPGPIIYVFSNWQVVIREALDALTAASPRKSGRFQASFIVVVNGKTVSAFDDIPSDAEVIITNAQPYARKVQVGAMRMTVPPRMFDVARKQLISRFGAKFIRAEVKFLNIASGLHPLIPYVLKGRAKSRRKDRQAGMPITYPSLVLNMVQ